ncbi:WYL domain-containing protein [Pseudonocardia ailaonensis]|uniref:WYL domain-containing protein n=1 Tax=Pseudonocardia ailaonensis TaxID=367279 RepID=UPI0031D0132F
MQLLPGRSTIPPDLLTWGAGPPARATIRISPEGIPLATLPGLRVRPETDPDGWCEATFRLGPGRRAAADLLALGPTVEVLGPEELRAEVAGLARRTAALYARGTT